MKKWKSGLMLLVLLCLIPLMSALAWTGTVTASSLTVRKSNTTESKAIATLRKGAQVEVLETKGSWYKIKDGSRTGYVAKKYIKKGSDSSSDDSKSSSKSSSSSSKSSSSSSSGKEGDPCRVGDKGAAVRWVQRKLKNLGYLSDVDGDYGTGTKNAVKAFQKRNGLSADGQAGAKTIEKLKSKNAKKASGGSGSSGGGGSDDGTGTESLSWFKHPDRIPHHATFKVKDIRTGKVFNVKRWSGVNHADCEPASASDTKIMKSIYGSWSWRRRPILVKYNGHVYAASMNGMPHGTQTIKNNNFNGHFCIHFTGSKTHGSKKVDSAHQSCVKEALKHSW